jgi:hypothetical protein
LNSTNLNPRQKVDNSKIHSNKRWKGKEDNHDIEPRPNKNKEHLLYKYSKQIPLGEAILINNLPVFLQIHDGKPVLTENIELETITLLPPSISAYLSKEYVFSSAREIESYIQRAKTQTMDSLFYQVKGIWKKYFDVEAHIINICAADTIFTYFQDKLGMTHYLLFVGDNNTGKSNALTIFEQLAYRPLKDISISPANIYNFLGQFEEGQGIILEDEIDNIEEQEEKMRIYKAGYTKGAKVTRMYDSSSGLAKAREQKRYNTYCFKAFSSEKQPTFYKAKGFIERIFTVRCSSGTPQYDITEVINDAGDPRYKKLFRELEDLRRLLLIYRILNYDKPIPDLDLSIKNRDKQLCKPLVRLFQNSKTIDEILDSLTKFISEKRSKKLDSFDSFLYSLVVDLAKQANGYQVSNEDIWTIICDLPGNPIPNRPQSYQTNEFGILSKTIVTKICDDKFGAKKVHDGKQRLLKFDTEVLKRLADNYSPPNQIEIIRRQDINSFNAFNAFWKIVDEISGEKRKRSIINLAEIDQLPYKNQEKSEKEIQITSANTISMPEEQDADSIKVLKPLEVLERQKEIEKDLKSNNMIPESGQNNDMDDNNVINIHKIANRIHEHSDIWKCKTCDHKGDKWDLLNHYSYCRNNWK